MLAALVGCAGPPEPVPPPPPAGLVVLLPEPDGKPTAIAVANQAGSQILARPYEATRVGSATEAPTAPTPLDPSEVARVFGPVLAALPEPPAVFLLYFDVKSTELTAESRALLPRVLDAIRVRSSADTSVVGHTDTVGAKEPNWRLALERAQAVADLLVVRGVDPRILHIASHGEEVPLVRTGDEVSEPRNRRVEVTVR